MTKVCTKCGRELDTSMFRKNNKCKDGLYYQCKDCDHLDRQTKYKDKIKEYSIKNKNKINEYSKQHYKNNTEYYKEYDRQRSEKRKILRRTEDYKQKARDYENNKRKTDIHYRLDRNILSYISRILKNKNSPIIEKLYGYSSKQLREHIESQFTPEMNWDNYGSYWELDHIIPRYQFYYESYEDEQAKQCWALSNLRPLTIEENRTRRRS